MTRQELYTAPRSTAIHDTIKKFQQYEDENCRDYRAKVAAKELTTQYVNLRNWLIESSKTTYYRVNDYYKDYRRLGLSLKEAYHLADGDYRTPGITQDFRG